MQLINIGNKNTNPLNMIKLAEASNGLEPGKPTVMALYSARYCSTEFLL